MFLCMFVSILTTNYAFGAEEASTECKQFLELSLEIVVRYKDVLNKISEVVSKQNKTKLKNHKHKHTQKKTNGSLKVAKIENIGS